MFKKTIAALCLCALLCPSAASLAGSGGYLLAKPQQGAFVMMRSKPKGSVIARFFPGAPVVEAGDRKQGWIKITVGDRDAALTGYVPDRDTLLDAASADDTLCRAMPLYTSPFSSWALYAEPSNEAPALATFGFDEVIQLMGICRNWWMVRCGGKIGFIPAGTESVLEETLGILQSDAPEGTLPLRAEPDEGAASLGDYYRGTLARVLPGTDKAWAKVNIRGAVGYLPKADLDIGAQPGDATPALPTRKVPANCPLWDQPDTGSIQRVGPAQESIATVIGKLDEWYHVRLGNAYGFIEASIVE